MSVFFVSALLLLVALSFGTTDALGNPRFGSTLDNIEGIFDADLPAGDHPLAWSTPSPRRRSAC